MNKDYTINTSNNVKPYAKYIGETYDYPECVNNNKMCITNVTQKLKPLFTYNFDDTMRCIKNNNIKYEVSNNDLIDLKVNYNEPNTYFQSCSASINTLYPQLQARYIRILRLDTNPILISKIAVFSRIYNDPIRTNNVNVNIFVEPIYSYNNKLYYGDNILNNTDNTFRTATGSTNSYVQIDLGLNIDISYIEITHSDSTSASSLNGAIVIALAGYEVDSSGNNIYGINKNQGKVLFYKQLLNNDTFRRIYFHDNSTDLPVVIPSVMEVIRRYNLPCDSCNIYSGCSGCIGSCTGCSTYTKYNNTLFRNHEYTDTISNRCYKIKNNDTNKSILDSSISGDIIKSTDLGNYFESCNDNLNQTLYSTVSGRYIKIIKKANLVPNSIYYESLNFNHISIYTFLNGQPSILNNTDIKSIYSPYLNTVSNNKIIYPDIILNSNPSTTTRYNTNWDPNNFKIGGTNIQYPYIIIDLGISRPISYIKITHFDTTDANTLNGAYIFIMDTVTDLSNVGYIQYYTKISNNKLVKNIPTYLFNQVPSELTNYPTYLNVNDQHNVNGLFCTGCDLYDNVCSGCLFNNKRCDGQVNCTGLSLDTCSATPGCNIYPIPLACTGTTRCDSISTSDCIDNGCTLIYKSNCTGLLGCQTYTNLTCQNYSGCFLTNAMQCNKNLNCIKYKQSECTNYTGCFLYDSNTGCTNPTYCSSYDINTISCGDCTGCNQCTQVNNCSLINNYCGNIGNSTNSFLTCATGSCTDCNNYPMNCQGCSSGCKNIYKKCIDTPTCANISIDMISDTSFLFKNHMYKDVITNKCFRPKLDNINLDTLHKAVKNTLPDVSNYFAPCGTGFAGMTSDLGFYIYVPFSTFPNYKYKTDYPGTFNFSYTKITYNSIDNTFNKSAINDIPIDYTNDGLSYDLTKHTSYFGMGENSASFVSISNDRGFFNIGEISFTIQFDIKFKTQYKYYNRTKYPVCMLGLGLVGNNFIYLSTEGLRNLSGFNPSIYAKARSNSHNQLNRWYNITITKNITPFLNIHVDNNPVASYSYGGGSSTFNRYSNKLYIGLLEDFESRGNEEIFARGFDGWISDFIFVKGISTYKRINRQFKNK